MPADQPGGCITRSINHAFPFTTWKGKKMIPEQIIKIRKAILSFLDNMENDLGLNFEPQLIKLYTAVGLKDHSLKTDERIELLTVLKNELLFYSLSLRNEFLEPEVYSVPVKNSNMQELIADYDNCKEKMAVYKTRRYNCRKARLHCSNLLRYFETISLMNIETVKETFPTHYIRKPKDDYKTRDEKVKAIKQELQNPTHFRGYCKDHYKRFGYKTSSSMYNSLVNEINT